MAKNDIVLLDALVDERLKTIVKLDRSEVFEFLVIEQRLKSYDLSKEELEAGWTDGTHDGGIDGFFTIVNGRLLTDAATFVWPRSSAEIEVFLFTCKHHDTFQQVPLDAMLATLQEIFDLSKSNSDLAGAYSSSIRGARELFIGAYRQLSLLRPTLAFEVIYASRGDTRLLGESVKARGEQIEKLLCADFSASKCSFVAWGAAEIVQAYRQTKSFSLSLPFQEHLTAGDEGYVVLSKLKDYCGFVTDERGSLRRYLFDSNVRDFLGENAVNSDIALTLQDASAPHFWWLNNGVTILATSANVVGKQLQLKDIQIVNGLQSTESIYRHFVTKQLSTNGERSLLVKVIVAQDERIQDQVIRATNNQTGVLAAALHATDKIQRDIEEVLLRFEWYYERRTNYFRNAGRPEARIVTPLLLGAGAVALLLRNPSAASKLKQKHIRSTEAYDMVYSSHHPILAWVVIAECMKQAEQTLISHRSSKRTARANALSVWRGLLAYLVVSKHCRTFEFSSQDLASIKPNAITAADFNACWIGLMSDGFGATADRLSETSVEQACLATAKRHGIEGQPLFGRRALPRSTPTPFSRATAKATQEAVRKLLPQQPWKPGIHSEIASKLGISAATVSKAIAALIKANHFFDQKDGVVFDQNGTIIEVDTTRTDITDARRAEVIESIAVLREPSKSVTA